MSRLEAQVQPHVQPLLFGERSYLDTSAQLLVGCWAVKTAMVLDALSDPNDHTYTAPERTQLRLLSRIPPKTVNTGIELHTFTGTNCTLGGGASR